MNRCVLITGASRGIGAACARAFAREGDRVVIHYHNSKDKAEGLCRELIEAGCEAMTVCADVSDPDAVRELFLQIEKDFGTVDVLVNNAGVAYYGLFHEMNDAEWDLVIATDLGGAGHCCRAALPAMIRAHSGVIVNIASMWGETGASCEVAYSAAKAGVIGLTKVLAKEVAPSGVRVNAVSPGAIMTDMMRCFSEEELDDLTNEIPLGALGSPDDVAQAVVFLASDKAQYITGQILSVNGGMVI